MDIKFNEISSSSGFKHLIAWVNDSHHCGYLGLPRDHILYGAEYSEPHESLKMLDMDQGLGLRSPMLILSIEFTDRDACGRPDQIFDVHGSITFTGFWDSLDPAHDFWFFGFDCAHSGDKTRYSNFPGDIFRDVDYCKEQLKFLELQILNPDLYNK